MLQLLWISFAGEEASEQTAFANSSLGTRVEIMSHVDPSEGMPTGPSGATDVREAAWRGQLSQVRELSFPLARTRG